MTEITHHHAGRHPAEVLSIHPLTCYKYIIKILSLILLLL